MRVSSGAETMILRISCGIAILVIYLGCMLKLASGRPQQVCLKVVNNCLEKFENYNNITDCVKMKAAISCLNDGLHLCDSDQPQDHKNRQYDRESHSLPGEQIDHSRDVTHRKDAPDGSFYSDQGYYDSTSSSEPVIPSDYDLLLGDEYVEDNGNINSDFMQIIYKLFSDAQEEYAQSCSSNDKSSGVTWYVNTAIILSCSCVRYISSLWLN